MGPRSPPPPGYPEGGFCCGFDSHLVVPLVPVPCAGACLLACFCCRLVFFPLLCLRLALPSPFFLLLGCCLRLGAGSGHEFLPLSGLGALSLVHLIAEASGG